MKILIQFMGSIESGPVFSIELAKGLKNGDNDVYAILYNDVENKSEWIKLLGMSHIYFLKKFPQRRHIISSSIIFANELFCAKRVFKNILFDISIRTFPSKYDDIFYKFVKCKCRLNYCHDPIPHSGVTKKDAEENKKIINAAEYIVVLTESFIPVIEKKYGRTRNEIILSRHGTMHYSQKKEIKKPTYNPDLPINFLFFGRIDPYKGIDLLIKSFYNICKAGFIAKLTIAGKGDLNRYVDKIKSNNQIKVINRYILDTEIDELFRVDNTVLIIPYKDATQSGVVSIAYEYMVPIIASDTGGLREQLMDGNAGVLIPPNSVSALQDIMIRFITDTSYYIEGVEKVYKYKAFFDWNTIAKDLIKL